MTCKHEQFTTNAQILRIDDGKLYIANIDIRCNSCAAPFTFVGVPVDMMNPDGPCTNRAADKLCIPIQPPQKVTKQ